MMIFGAHRPFAAALVLFAACSAPPNNAPDSAPNPAPNSAPNPAQNPAPDAGAPATHRPSTCTPCVSTVDCGGEACVQLANDNDCASICQADADCASGEHCVALTNVEGVAISACLATSGSCGPIADSDDDGGSPQETVDAGATTHGCGELAGPTEATDACHCQRPGACAANSCYGGWFCDTANGRCVRPPAGCTGGSVDAVSRPDAGSVSRPDAGSVWRPDAGSVSMPDAGTGGTVPSGTVDAHVGGRTGRLYFAVVGDTRPGRIDDTPAYPRAVITGIYGALARLAPLPDFVVTTGDYMFATPGRGQDGPQMQEYLAAREQLPRPLWAALGNHECTGATNSNCGPEASHMTTNYQTFITGMMQPIGETLPYYGRRVDDVNGRWTAKFVVVAPNAWGPKQAAWFEAQLAVATTYTFVVHHEPSAATQAPGMPEVNQIVRRHPVTLSIVGHTHTWTHKPGEVVIGNGGAPLTGQTGSVAYGYTLFSQRPDGAIEVQAINSQTGRAFQTFAVHADGSSAP